MNAKPVLVWFRQDLRLQDNPALLAACAAHPIVPVYIFSPKQDAEAAPGAASRWWLHQSLVALDAKLQERGGRLVIRTGDPLTVLQELLTQTQACGVYWNRRYEPSLVKRDKHIKETLLAAGFQAHSFNGSLLFEPWNVATLAAKPYTVFTPFWRACLGQASPPPPAPAPKSLRFTENWPHSMQLDELGLVPKITWWSGFGEVFTPGEAGAQAALRRFIKRPLLDYKEGRDRPEADGVSRLSPHFHFGELSPQAAFHGASQALAKGDVPAEQAHAFTRELGWREFAYHLLWHFPHTVREPLNSSFKNFPWGRDPQSLRAWQKGETGYPLVDAGMRELWHTGFMHNRVRMVVASFLIKHLLLPWQEGAAWFWDTLVDADLASNTLGWQWTAGCGADAAPFFRIFNPTLQAQKFDANGTYVRKWVPELAKLPAKFINNPSAAPSAMLAEAKVTLGKTYPRPIVEHAFARQRALDALASLKQRAPRVDVA